MRSYDHWLTAGITWITAPDIPHIEPQIIVNPSARPFISDKVQDVINRLLPVLADTARRHYVFATKIELSGFVDPEEDAREVVITQWVKLSPQAALDYWDQLGRVLEFSSDSLPEELKTLADERLAIEVRWEANDRTP
ncbi:MAG: hypothetical protein ACREI2_00065 [Nitrospiraceae bacterium]